MRILLSSYYLDLSGVPTYTLTLYNELVRRGHDVTVYSPKGGSLSRYEKAPLSRIMGSCDSLAGLGAPAIIIAQANLCSIEMRLAYPKTPMIFSAHGVLPELEQPPVGIDVQHYTAINEDTRDNLIAHGIDESKITLVRDFVDTDRFTPTAPLHNDVRRVVFISNFRKGKAYDTIKRTCQLADVHLNCYGAPYGRSYEIEREINRAEIVITTGRGILEAMSCGRAVISFGQGRGDGYLMPELPELYLESRRRNFAGSKCRYVFTAETLAAEIAKYNPADGAVNRGIALDHHGHVAGVDKLLAIIERAMQ